MNKKNRWNIRNSSESKWLAFVLMEGRRMSPAAVCAGTILIYVLISDPEKAVNSWMARPAGGTKLFKEMKTRTDCEEFQKILTGFFHSKTAYEIQCR